MLCFMIKGNARKANGSGRQLPVYFPLSSFIYSIYSVQITVTIVST